MLISSTAPLRLNCSPSLDLSFAFSQVTELGQMAFHRVTAHGFSHGLKSLARNLSR